MAHKLFPRVLNEVQFNLIWGVFIGNHTLLNITDAEVVTLETTVR